MTGPISTTNKIATTGTREPARLNEAFAHLKDIGTDNLTDAQQTVIKTNLGIQEAPPTNDLNSFVEALTPVRNRATKIVDFIDDVSLQNTSTTSVTVSSGYTKYFSFRGDTSPFSTTKTDGYIAGTGIAYDSTQNTIEGLNPLVAGSTSSILLVHVNRTYAINTSYTLLGFDTPSGEIPLIRLSGGVLQYNQTGTRTVDYQNFGTGTATSITGLQGDIHFLIEVLRLANSQLRLIVSYAIGDTGAPVNLNDVTINATNIDMNNVTGEFAGAGQIFEFANADHYISHANQTLLESHRTERLFGIIQAGIHSVTHDTITANVDIQGTLTVNGVAVSTGGGGGGGGTVNYEDGYAEVLAPPTVNPNHADYSPPGTITLPENYTDFLFLHVTMENGTDVAHATLSTKYLASVPFVLATGENTSTGHVPIRIQGGTDVGWSRTTRVLTSNGNNATTPANSTRRFLTALLHHRITAPSK